MFEEQSKQYVDDNYYDLIEQVQQVAYQSHQDGINFGYNQARKEMSDIGLALHSDMDKTIRQNLELKKENEELRAEHFLDEFPPVGAMIRDYEYNLIKDNLPLNIKFHKCDNSKLLKSEYPVLYARMIENSYSKNTSDSFFNLPNIEGAYIRLN